MYIVSTGSIHSTPNEKKIFLFGVEECRIVCVHIALVDWDRLPVYWDTAFQCSWLQIHHDPHQDKVVTEN